MKSALDLIFTSLDRMELAVVMVVDFVLVLLLFDPLVVELVTSLHALELEAFVLELEAFVFVSTPWIFCLFIELEPFTFVVVKELD